MSIVLVRSECLTAYTTKFEFLYHLNRKYTEKVRKSVLLLTPKTKLRLSKLMVQELWKSICNFYHKVDTVQVSRWVGLNVAWVSAA